MFSGILQIADKCDSCGLDLRAQDSGDGPTFFVLIIVGFLVVGLASWVEIAYQPPIWLHVLLWVPFILISSIFLLRLFKSLLISWQYRQNLGFDKSTDKPDD